MKNYLLLFLTAGFLSLGACSNDDDGETAPETDPIVGTWELTAVNPAVFNPQGCGDDRSTITFNDDNTGTGTYHLESSNCEPDTSPVSWTRNTNGVYSIEIPIPIVESQKGTVEFENNNDRFVFSPQGIPNTSLTFERVED